MRNLSPSFAAALEQEIVYPIYFIEAEFKSGTLYLWTGYGEREWNGKTWSGIGWILGISEVEETSEIKATSLTIGVPSNPEMNSIALADIQRNKPLTIWLGLMAPPVVLGDPETGEVLGAEPTEWTLGDPGTGEELGDPGTGEVLGEAILQEVLGEPGGLIDAPYCVFKGLCDIGEIDVDPNKPAVRIRYKSRIADLERARERRMTHEDQQIEFPGDMFYQYTGGLSDVVINWGNSGSG
ncbi:MAG: hypothetical protein LCH93_13830 [Proteobacteria bacterium]|nr:hypothetical protein [Pseudomonadota bacterium]